VLLTENFSCGIAYFYLWYLNIMIAIFMSQIRWTAQVREMEPNDTADIDAARGGCKQEVGLRIK
jgi:hypothetical protein